MSEHELKDCPFCGSQPELKIEEQRIDRSDAWVHVRCRRCSVAPSVSRARDTGYYDPYDRISWVVTKTFAQASEEAANDAVRIWNDRP